MTGVRVRAAVGLGSNQGERRVHLALARRRLGEILERMVSSDVYETQPVGGGGERPYLNMCCVGETRLEPRVLLSRLQETEAEAGRLPVGAPGRSGPRPLDLDLLLYGDRRVEEPGLVVPHPRLPERAFVLVPLSEVAPDWPVPGFRATVAEIAGRVGRESVARVGSLEDLGVEAPEEG